MEFPTFTSIQDDFRSSMLKFSNILSTQNTNVLNTGALCVCARSLVLVERLKETNEFTKLIPQWDLLTENHYFTEESPNSVVLKMHD